MPIEINEIAIQFQVRDNAGNRTAVQDDAASIMDRDAIVADCVARVLRALKTQRER